MTEDFLQQHPKLEKWFRKLPCVCFSKELLQGSPEVLQYAEAKFLHAHFGIRRNSTHILVTDPNGNGEELETHFTQMLQLATPAHYAVKNEDLNGFFAPFEAEILSSAQKEYAFLTHLLTVSPKEAALYLLVQTRFTHANIYEKERIARLARKFDAYLKIPAVPGKVQ